MRKISILVLCAALAGFGASPVLAQSSGTSSTMAAKPAHTAKSLECSKEADAKGLHGKARKHFRSACKHGKSM
ncbi:MAG TPA: PsiF family protein [Methylovirgula sp.]